MVEGDTFAYFVIPMTFLILVETMFYLRYYENIVKTITAKPLYQEDYPTGQLPSLCPLTLDLEPLIAVASRTHVDRVKAGDVPKMTQKIRDAIFETRAEKLHPGRSITKSRTLMQLLLYQHTLLIASVLKSQLGWRGVEIWWARTNVFSTVLINVAPHIAPLVSMVLLTKIFEDFVLATSHDSLITRHNLMTKEEANTSKLFKTEQEIKKYLFWRILFTMVEIFDMSEEYKRSHQIWALMDLPTKRQLAQAFVHLCTLEAQAGGLDEQIALKRSNELISAVDQWNENQMDSTRLALSFKQLHRFILSTRMHFDTQNKDIIESITHMYFTKIENLEKQLFGGGANISFLGFLTLLMTTVPHLRRQFRDRFQAEDPSDVVLESLQTMNWKNESTTDRACSSLLSKYGVKRIDPHWIINEVTLSHEISVAEAKFFIEQVSHGENQATSKELSDYISEGIYL